MLNRLLKKLPRLRKRSSRTILVHTIYFGGGTPNLLSVNQLGTIIKTIKDHFNVASEIEMSIEANPTCIPMDYLKALRETGINRLSLGMQSASKKDLEILGRKHSFNDVEKSVENARNAGFSNINLDLIFGIPYQSLKSFEETLVFCHWPHSKSPFFVRAYGRRFNSPGFSDREKSFT